MQDIRHDLRQFIVDNFLFGQVTTDAPFSDDESLLEAGIVDSTGILELVGFLEQHYSMMIADDELVPENLDSVSQLVRFVERKRALSAQ
jgi:acyl carrier protein